MAKAKEKFPEQIYVGKEHDGDSDYLVADDAPDGLSVMNDNRSVAIYKLVREATVRNKTEVV